MSKLRFTDAEKWRDPWYQALPLSLKALWQYLTDNCDNAGVWVVNQREAEFHLGHAIDWQAAAAAFEGRVRAMPSGKWHVVKFVQFQYPGGLSLKSAPHRQVLRLLALHGLPSPFNDDQPPTPTREATCSLHSRLHSSPKDTGVGKDKDSSSSGSPEGATPADRFRALLVELIVADGPTAIKKWWSLAKSSKHATCFEDQCDLVRWCVAQGRARGAEVQYASEVLGWAKEWRPKATE